MIHIEGEILIARPAEVVFDTVADQRYELLYNPRMLRSVKLTAGPIGAGTQFRATTRSWRRSVTMLIEHTDFDRPRRLSSTTTTATASIRGTLTFAAESTATRLHWSWEVCPKGSLTLVGPVIRRAGERQERRIWTGLKRFLETPPLRLPREPAVTERSEVQQ